MNSLRKILIFILVVSWGTGSVFAKAANVSTGNRPPNIVFIMADDLGSAHLGVYGQKYIATPNLDRMAAQGVRFTQAYAGASNCGPSRASLMSGLHGGHTSMRQNDGGIPLAAGDTTVADVLKQAGYATGCFGKWGLGDFGTEGVPWRRGFDNFFGYLHQKHAHFYHPEYLWENGQKYPLSGNTGGRKEQYAHDIIMEKAERFIRNHRDQPFFCYLPLTLPHHEFIVPEESMAKYRGKFEEHPLAHWRDGYALPKEPKATLAAMISHLDQSVGRVLSLLEELGLDRETLVIFTSDNGGENGELTNAAFFRANGDLRGFKQDLYEGGIRVPAIARWPGQIAPGTVSAQPWYFADVMPTLAEMAGVANRVPARADGISFLPTLLGSSQRQKQHDYFYWEKRESSGALRQALRQGNWKAVALTETLKSKLELYDLEKDPGEQHDLSAQDPTRVAAFKEILAHARVEPPPQIEPSRPAGLDYR